MSREIKFRAWNKSTSIMIACEDLNLIEDNGEMCEPFSDNDGCLIHLPLMQFTGLQDRNGVDIYEGDIVNFEKRNISTNMTEDFTNIVVEWSCEHAGFTLGYVDSVMSEYYDYTVIGNIYENSDLVKN